jgi:hypothetical protein
MKKFIDTALAVASREAQIEGLTGSVKESRAAANAVKIEAYADIIAALASVPLTSKGKLPRAVSTDLRDTLLEAGVSKSCTKRYVENSTAAMRVFSIPSQATPTLVEEILATENIDSENALKKACFNSREVSDVRAFAEKLVGKFKTRFTDGGSEVATDDFHPSKLTDDQIDAALEELEDAMRELRAARAAAKVAANAAQPTMSRPRTKLSAPSWRLAWASNQRGLRPPPSTGEKDETVYPIFPRYCHGRHWFCACRGKRDCRGT